MLKYKRYQQVSVLFLILALTVLSVVPKESHANQCEIHYAEIESAIKDLKDKMINLDAASGLFVQWRKDILIDYLDSAIDYLYEDEYDVRYQVSWRISIVIRTVNTMQDNDVLTESEADSLIDPAKDINLSLVNGYQIDPAAIESAINDLKDKIMNLDAASGRFGESKKDGLIGYLNQALEYLYEENIIINHQVSRRIDLVISTVERIRNDCALTEEEANSIIQPALDINSSLVY